MYLVYFGSSSRNILRATAIAEFLKLKRSEKRIKIKKYKTHQLLCINQRQISVVWLVCTVLWEITLSANRGQSCLYTLHYCIWVNKMTFIQPECMIVTLLHHEYIICTYFTSNVKKAVFLYPVEIPCSRQFIYDPKLCLFFHCSAPKHHPFLKVCLYVTQPNMSAVFT